MVHGNVASHMVRGVEGAIVQVCPVDNSNFECNDALALDLALCNDEQFSEYSVASTRSEDPAKPEVTV
jgi:hypothetical protein